MTARAHYETQGWWGGKLRGRAVASLETRTRVVASLEVSNSRECDSPINLLAVFTKPGRACQIIWDQARTRACRLS